MNSTHSVPLRAWQYCEHHPGRDSCNEFLLYPGSRIYPEHQGVPDRLNDRNDHARELLSALFLAEYSSVPDWFSRRCRLRCQRENLRPDFPAEKTIRIRRQVYHAQCIQFHLHQAAYSDSGSVHSPINRLLFCVLRRDLQPIFQASFVPESANL